MTYTQPTIWKKGETLAIIRGHASKPHAVPDSGPGGQPSTGAYEVDE